MTVKVHNRRNPPTEGDLVFCSVRGEVRVARVSLYTKEYPNICEVIVNGVSLLEIPLHLTSPITPALKMKNKI